MGNLTLGQKIAMALILIQAIAGGSAQLTPVFGQHVTIIMVSLASLAGTVVTGWIFVVTGQSYQVQNVRDLALNPASSAAPAAQKALVEATSAIVGSSAAGPAITKEAKVALLDATASLPEVKGQITVTDKSLEAATVSPQVKAG